MVSVAMATVPELGLRFAAGAPGSQLTLVPAPGVTFPSPGTFDVTGANGNTSEVQFHATDPRLGGVEVDVYTFDSSPLATGLLYVGAGLRLIVNGTDCRDDRRFIVDELSSGTDGTLNRAFVRFEVRCPGFPPGSLVRGTASWNTTQSLSRTISTAAVDFSDVTYPGASAPVGVTVTNDGARPLPIGDVRVTSPRFELASTSCANITLAPRASCTAFVRANTTVPWPTSASGYLIIEDAVASLTSGTGGSWITLVSHVVFPVSYPEGQYTAVTPARVYDSRGGPAFVAGERRDVQVAGRGGVPISGASDVVLNVTATRPTRGGFLTVWPSDAPQPSTSNLNFVAGQTVPNMVVARIGANGSIAVFAEVPTDVLIDVVGFFGGPTASRGSFFRPIDPVRWFDTRSDPRSNGEVVPIGPGDRVFTSFTRGNPRSQTGFEAVALNVTAVLPTEVSYLSVGPEGSPSDASSLNYAPGQVVPNAVISMASADAGEVSFRNAAGDVDVIVDVFGAFNDGATGTLPVTRYRALSSPARVIDSRRFSWQDAPITGAVSAYNPRTVALAGGVVPATAKAVILNVTVISVEPGYLQISPSDRVSETSSLNYAAHQTVANTVISKLGPDGRIVVRHNDPSILRPGLVDVIVDVFGWFE